MSHNWNRITKSVDPAEFLTSDEAESSLESIEAICQSDISATPPATYDDFRKQLFDAGLNVKFIARTLRRLINAVDRDGNPLYSIQEKALKLAADMMNYGRPGKPTKAQAKKKFGFPDSNVVSIAPGQSALLAREDNPKVSKNGTSSIN